MTAQPRTVVVVDDAAEVRLLLKIQLEQWGNFTVVGEGGDGVEAVDLARVHQPELMVLDVSMPRMDGLEALPHIGEVSPGTKVVMYTGFDERGLAARARALGAAGLIEKSMSIDGLAEQLESVLRAAPPVGVDAQIAPTEPVQEDPSSPEQVLGEHLERFREVFEKAAIGMATMTLTGQVVRANKALAAVLGRDVRELVGIGYGSLVAEAEQPALARAFHDAQHEGGVVVRFEHGVQVYGRSRWLLATLAPVRDSRGRALYLFLQAQDVTAQRSAEEALRQSEERFALLVEAVQDYAIFMLDRGGHVASWNTGAQRINGYQVDEIIGRHFRTFYPEEKQRARHPERELELAIEHGHYEEEGWRVRKDGSQFWASVVITAVYDRNGRHIGFAKVTRDIDERRSMMLDRERAAAALSSANAGLETANQRLAQEAADQAQFLAVTAHEIRSPIGVLTGAAKLLTGHWPELDEVERSELLQSMSTASERLQRLLSDLLMASRLEAKAMQLQLSPTDLSELLARAIAAARAAQPDGEIRLIGSRGLTVLADADRLAQALDNLIANALRHGRAPVEVAAQQCGASIEITVRDSGPGVAADVQPRLFQRFTTGTKRGGTGLGLFIVRELARAHGGDAWYRSIDGGSEFVLSLPTPSTP